MRAQLVRAGIQRGVGRTDRAGEGAGRFDDARLDEIVRDLVDSLAGFDGEGLLFPFRTGEIDDLGLVVVLVHGAQLLQSTETEDATDRYQGDRHNRCDDDDTMAALLRLAAAAHVATGFRRLRRLGRIRSRSARGVDPLRVVREKIVKIVGHRLLFSSFLAWSSAVCRITTADC